MKRLLLVVVLVLMGILPSCQKPLTQPGPVMQNNPADSAVLRSSDVAFSWLAAEHAVAYELQVAPDSKFDAPPSDDTVVAESVQVNVGPDGRYFWRVRAWSADSVWGDWSDARRFDVERFRIVASVKTQGYPHDVSLNGGRAYVADGQAGLGVFDISSPEAPALLGTKMDSMNEAWGVVSADSYAYVAYGNKELYIVKVSRPESLKVAGEIEYYQPSYGFDIAGADTFVYIAADAQFIILNVAQPAYPSQVIQFRYPHSCRGVTVMGSWCYLACEQLGVAVWEWNRDTALPKQVGSFDTPANAQAVATSGSYLYVADGRNGLIVADLSDPENPLPVATLPLEGYARGVTVHDSLAYVSCGAGGLAVVNVASPGLPVLVATVSLPYTMCAQAEGGYVFAGDRDSGLAVIKIEE